MRYQKCFCSLSLSVFSPCALCNPLTTSSSDLSGEPEDFLQQLQLLEEAPTQSGTGALFLPLHIVKFWATLPSNNLIWYHLLQEIAAPLHVIHQSCLQLPSASAQVLHFQLSWICQTALGATIPNSQEERIFYTLCKQPVEVFPMRCFEAKILHGLNMQLSKFME